MKRCSICRAVLRSGNTEDVCALCRKRTARPIHVAEDDDGDDVLVKKVDIKNLVESPNNLRKTFDPVAMDELALSIRNVGIRVPLLCRLVNKKLEIVCGHRRFRAAREAGLHLLPVIIEEIDDAEARQMQLIENCQREGISPLEEAAGYKELMRQHNIGLCQLVKRVGKSKAHIHNRLRMLDTPEISKALSEGKISAVSATKLLQCKPVDRKRILRNPNPVSGLSFTRRIAKLKGLEVIICPTCRKGYINVEEWRSP